jgi:hypothetical protein
LCRQENKHTPEVTVVPAVRLDPVDPVVRMVLLVLLILLIL